MIFLSIGLRQQSVHAFYGCATTPKEFPSIEYAIFLLSQKEVIESRLFLVSFPPFSSYSPLFFIMAEAARMVGLFEYSTMNPS